MTMTWRSLGYSASARGVRSGDDVDVGRLRTWEIGEQVEEVNRLEIRHLG